MITKLDGKKLANDIIDDLKNTTSKLKAVNLIPKLVVIKVGDDTASEIYIKNKSKACKEVGIDFIDLKYPKDISYNSLLGIIKDYNKEKSINGIIIQQPLPKHLQGIEQFISKEKDVDGFTSANIGNIFNKEQGLQACTPLGIIKLLDNYNINLQSKNVIIIGRSKIVGKPLIGMLLNKNATVTSCNSYTENLELITGTADILITAIGKPKYIHRDYITSKCKCIIDVGINKDQYGKICGDVDYDNIINYWESINDNKERFITPVPGGVGPLTVTMLLNNVIIACERQNSFIIS